MKIVPVILSGGSGTRLWPLSFLITCVADLIDSSIIFSSVCRPV
jgi:hypothetical protein